MTEKLSELIERHRKNRGLLYDRVLQRWFDQAKHLEANLHSSRNHNESLNEALGKLIRASERVLTGCTPYSEHNCAYASDLKAALIDANIVYTPEAK